MVVVVRYYGGTNLGVGGLIKAYRNAAALALDAGKIRTEWVRISWGFEFPFERMSTVMTFIKSSNGQIKNRQQGNSCKIREDFTLDIQPLEQLRKCQEVGVDDIRVVKVMDQ